MRREVREARGTGDRRSTVDRRRLVVAVSLEGTRAHVAARRLADVARLVLRAEHVRDALISIALVPTRRITAMNARYLRHRGPTDVIAFGLHGAGFMGIVGDIYIAPAVARTNALRHGVAVREELVRLVVHGVLHVLGYEHPEGASRERSKMWRRQEALLARALRDAAA